jgi:hypothetical protein
VISTVDDRLRREARTYHLLFRCEECANYDAEAACCVHGYPIEPNSNVDLSEVTEVSFCKEFEVG